MTSRRSNADWMFAEYRATGYYEAEDFAREDEAFDEAEDEFWFWTALPDAVEDAVDARLAREEGR